MNLSTKIILLSALRSSSRHREEWPPSDEEGVRTTVTAEYSHVKRSSGGMREVILYLSFAALIILTACLAFDMAKKSAKVKDEFNLFISMGVLDERAIASDLPLYDLLDLQMPASLHTREGVKNGYRLKVVPAGNYTGLEGMFGAGGVVVSLSSGSDLYAAEKKQMGVLCNAAPARSGRVVMIAQEKHAFDFGDFPSHFCPTLLKLARRGY